MSLRRSLNGARERGNCAVLDEKVTVNPGRFKPSGTWPITEIIILLSYDERKSRGRVLALLANRFRATDDRGYEGPRGDKTSHEHCTRWKHTIATSAEFCRARLRWCMRVCACITRKHGTMRCHSW